MPKKCDHKHPSHKDDLPRLRKILGQVEGIEKMINNERYCIDILQQVSAIKSALNSLQANILQRHLATCVQDVFACGKKQEIEEKIEELKRVFIKY